MKKMIETILKQTKRWLCIGFLAAAGCASNVKQEEFYAYIISAEMTESMLKDQITELKKKDMWTRARHDTVLRKIEEINARLSVSSVDSYAIALEEQITQDARQYIKLARAVAALHKKEWDLGDTTAREIAKLREDMKANSDSLLAKTTELKKVFEEAKKTYETFRNEDYTIFKDQNLKETSEHQKKMKAFETNLKNLAHVIHRLDKNIDPAAAFEEKGEDATEFAYTELRRQIAGFRTISLEPIAGYETVQNISDILTTKADGELVERVLGNMALGKLDLDDKIAFYSKAIEILSGDVSQDKRLYGSLPQDRSGMLAIRDELIILKMKSLVGEKQSTVMRYVDDYAKLPRMSKQQSSTHVLLDLFGGIGNKAADLGEILLTFANGELVTVQTASDGTHAAILQEQLERYQQLVPTNNKEVDELNQRLFERDKKEYIKEKVALKRSYADSQLQKQTDILRKKYAHLFEDNK